MAATTPHENERLVDSLNDQYMIISTNRLWEFATKTTEAITAGIDTTSRSMMKVASYSSSPIKRNWYNIRNGTHGVIFILGRKLISPKFPLESWNSTKTISSTDPNTVPRKKWTTVLNRAETGTHHGKKSHNELRGLSLQSKSHQHWEAHHGCLVNIPDHQLQGYRSILIAGGVFIYDNTSSVQDRFVQVSSFSGWNPKTEGLTDTMEWVWRGEVDRAGEIDCWGMNCSL